MIYPGGKDNLIEIAVTSTNFLFLSLRKIVAFC